MKLLGMIGGMGPESTIDYYKLFIETWRERVTDGSYPRLVITSVDLSRMLKWINANELDAIAAHLLEEIRRLQRAGAEVALLTANTPHIVFDRLKPASPIPLISIVETTCQAAAAQGRRRVGLVGTRFTMQAGFYQKVFEREGIELVVPDMPDQEYIHSHYMSDLINGIFLPTVRDAFVGIAQRMQKEHAIEGLILGGTEIPLLLRGASGLDMPLLDTTLLHVQRAVEECMGSD